MDVQYAPDDVKLGDEIDPNNKRSRGEVIAIGKAVVVVRDKAGYTRTLLRKIVQDRKNRRTRVVP